MHPSSLSSRHPGSPQVEINADARRPLREVKGMRPHQFFARRWGDGRQPTYDGFSRAPAQASALSAIGGEHWVKLLLQPYPSNGR
jgi:hypothetical protein